MKPYEERQHELFEELESRFKKDRNSVEIVEPVSDYVSDNRICLTSVVFLPEYVAHKVNNRIIERFSGIDERQYFYVPESLHLTIQNVRTAHDPPLFTKNDIEHVKRIFRKIVPRYNQFTFYLRGLFETPTSFSVRGYCSEDLHNLIVSLRKEMISEGVPDNKKYGSNDVFFGNITCLSFYRKAK